MWEIQPRPATHWNITWCDPPLNSNGSSLSWLLPTAREKPSILTAYFQSHYATLLRRKVEGETDESGEQAIMEVPTGDAFAGTEQLTVVGRRLHPGGTA